MTYRIYLRSHAPDEQGRILERIEPTGDPVAAEAAYRRLLSRDDLTGQPVAAVLSSTIPTGGRSGSAIYFSRYDREFGDGRIHPNAPLDLMRTDDGTAEATAWLPQPDVSVDYETDPRAFPECLKDFALRANGGHQYGSRPKAAEELRISEATLKGWLDGRPCGHEKAFRRLMTMIAAKQAGK